MTVFVAYGTIFFVCRIKNTEDESMSPESIINIASLIEDELFKLFNDVGTKYKAKYRSLMFNMKDSRNHVST